MEVKVHKRLILLSALLLAAFCAAPPLWSAPKPKKERRDSLVRIMKAESLEQLQKNGRQFRKAIASTFLHNGTYLISDTALWDTENKIINAWGHVKVIQDETILTSEKLDYFIDDNLAQFRGTLVQLQNKKRNTLRTRYLDYNTRDSMAIFRSGASMRDEKGQIIESINGTYSSHDKVFTFNDEVNMFSDSIFVKTVRLEYDSEKEKATFPHHIDFWKGGNMLSATEGWYDRQRQLFFFRNRVHGLSKEQEMWADSLYYYQAVGDIVLRGNAQIQDTTRKVTGVADYIHFQDSISQVTMRINAAIAMETESKGQLDTIYMGADTLIYRQIKMCDIPEGILSASKSRLADILTDAVTQFRRKAAEEAAKAQADAMQKQGPTVGKPAKAGADKPAAAEKPAAEQSKKQAPKGQASQPAAAAADSLARKDSLFTPLNQAAAAIDSLVGAVPDSTMAESPIPDDDFDMDAADSLLLEGAATDSIAPQADSVPPLDSAALKDSLARRDSIALADSLAAIPKDTTKIGFMYGIRNVRVFRRDIQARCDSLCYCDLDSVARFYLDPVVWNEGNRQYTSDSLFVLVGQSGPRKASLQSNAFVVTQQDSIRYDQIKGTEIMAYFDTLEGTLKRFDALGGASALFYLEENGELATVNKVETKMLSAMLKNSNIDQVFYFESPKNNAYPVVQLPKADHFMKGYSWRPDERPATPQDITDLTVRPGERSRYLARPRAEFKQTEIYFPGYMPRIRREIAIRDSLARIPRPKECALPDSVAIKDTLALPDSAASGLALRDSLAALDSLAVAGIAAAADSTGTAPATTSAPADTSARAVSPTPDDDPLAKETVDPVQKRKEEQEAKRKLRIARRDARIAAREQRWAELDRRDSLKLEAKKLKVLEKERARKLRILLARQKQEARDQAKLEKYIEKYRKKYEREQKRNAARKRSQGAEERGEIPASSESGEPPAGSDPVLRDDGTVDDSSVFSGGRIPRT